MIVGCVKVQPLFFLIFYDLRLLLLWLLITESRLSPDSSGSTFQEFRWFVCIPGLSCRVQGREESWWNKRLCDSKVDRLHFDAYLKDLTR